MFTKTNDFIVIATFYVYLTQ